MATLNDFTDHPDGIVWNASLVMLNYFRHGHQSHSCVSVLNSSLNFSELKKKISGTARKS